VLKCISDTIDETGQAVECEDFDLDYITQLVTFHLHIKIVLMLLNRRA